MHRGNRKYHHQTKEEMMNVLKRLDKVASDLEAIGLTSMAAAVDGVSNSIGFDKESALEMEAGLLDVIKGSGQWLTSIARGLGANYTLVSKYLMQGPQAIKTVLGNEAFNEFLMAFNSNINSNGAAQAVAAGLAAAYKALASDDQGAEGLAKESAFNPNVAAQWENDVIQLAAERMPGYDMEALVSKVREWPTLKNAEDLLGTTEGLSETTVTAIERRLNGAAEEARTAFLKASKKILTALGENPDRRLAIEAKNRMVDLADNLTSLPNIVSQGAQALNPTGKWPVPASSQLGKLLKSENSASAWPGLQQKYDNLIQSLEKTVGTTAPGSEERNLAKDARNAVTTIMAQILSASKLGTFEAQLVEKPDYLTGVDATQRGPQVISEREVQWWHANPKLIAAALALSAVLLFQSVGKTENIAKTERGDKVTKTELLSTDTKIETK